MTSTTSTTAPSFPEAPLTGAVYVNGAWLLTVVCPLCGRQHVHGGGTGLARARSFLGHRVPDCPSSARTLQRNGTGYVITDPQDRIGQALATGQIESNGPPSRPRYSLPSPTQSNPDARRETPGQTTWSPTSPTESNRPGPVQSSPTP